MAATGITGGATPPPDAWTGLKGAELLAAIASTHTPTSYLVHPGGPDGVFEVLKHTDSNAAGTGYENHFSMTVIPYGINGGAPDNFELLTIIQPQWWNALTTNYTSVSRDLFNLIPSPEGTAALRGDVPPGEVELTDQAVSADLKWRLGSGSIGASRLRVWEPPEGLKGDVARCLMYLATIYAGGIRRYETGSGEVWSENPGEGFTSAYGAQLMTWHRIDPPSEYELNRNKIFAEIQGNSNPYVEFPDVAEYLWGIKKGEVYSPDSNGQSGITPEDTTPLKAAYTLADSRINLFAPSVPEDAVWSVDGMEVKEKYLIPRELGAGTHVLRFVSSSWKGMVLIEIR